MAAAQHFDVAAGYCLALALALVLLPRPQSVGFLMTQA